MQQHSPYLSHILNRRLRNRVLRVLTKEIKASGLKVDFIAARGLSGTLIAVPLSELLKLPVAVVRKPNENSHGRNVESTLPHWDYANFPKELSYIFVDDFISSGDTLSETHNTLVREYCSQGININLIAAFVYADSSQSSPKRVIEQELYCSKIDELLNFTLYAFNVH